MREFFLNAPWRYHQRLALAVVLGSLSLLSAGCAVPPAHVLQQFPRIVRIPALENAGCCRTPNTCGPECGEQVTWPPAAAYAPAEVDGPVLDAPLTDAPLVPSPPAAYGHADEVESRAFHEFAHPPRLFPVPTRPVFGPR